jgi:hypothetical protein
MIKDWFIISSLIEKKALLKLGGGRKSTFARILVMVYLKE